MDSRGYFTEDSLSLAKQRDKSGWISRTESGGSVSFLGALPGGGGHGFCVLLWATLANCSDSWGNGFLRQMGEISSA